MLAAVKLIDASRPDASTKLEEDQERIEMWLRASTPQRVHVGALDLTVDFAAGEEMLTEVSSKFRPDHVAAELEAAGLRSTQWWTDAAGDFKGAIELTSKIAAESLVPLQLICRVMFFEVVVQQPCVPAGDTDDVAPLQFWMVVVPSSQSANAQSRRPDALICSVGSTEQPNVSVP